MTEDCLIFLFYLRNTSEINRRPVQSVPVTLNRKRGLCDAWIEKETPLITIVTIVKCVFNEAFFQMFLCQTNNHVRLEQEIIEVPMGA